MESDSKLEKISNDIGEIKISLAKVEMTLERNTESLVTHVKRTDLLESKVDLLKTEVLPVLPEIKQVIKWWKAISVVVIIAVTSANPSLIPLILKMFGVGP